MEAATKNADRGGGKAETPAAPNAASFEQTATREACQDLMVAYNRVLAGASRVGNKKENDPVAKFGSSSHIPSLTQRMVRTHVHGRLSEIAAACAQISAATPPSETAARQWLQGLREDCELVAGGLPTWRFRPLVLLPLIAPVAAFVSKYLNGWGANLLMALAAALLVTALAGYVSVRDSYRAKRELFLPDASKVDAMDRDEQLKVEKGNVYLVEDRAFASLERGKPRENEVDRTIGYLGLFLVVEGSAVLGLVFTHHWYWWIPTLVSFGGLVWMAVFDRVTPKRAWL